MKTSSNLLPEVSKQTKLAGHFAAGKLAAIEVHAPGTPKGERGPAGVRVQTLACTRATAGTERIDQRWDRNGRDEVGEQENSG